MRICSISRTKALSEDAKARLEAIREFYAPRQRPASRDARSRDPGRGQSARCGPIRVFIGRGSVSRRTANSWHKRSPNGRNAKTRICPSGAKRSIDVKLDAYIPTDYIPQVSQKIGAYQQLAAARSEAEVDDLAAGLRDRFGTLPAPLSNLVEITKLRTIALEKHVTRVVIDNVRLTLGVGSAFTIARMRFRDCNL